MRLKLNTAKKLLIYASIYVIYLVLGALVFQALEIENEMEERQITEAFTVRFRQKYNISSQDWTSIENFYQTSVRFRGNVTTWSFGNALAFAGSVLTTVGYGNITPRTTNGRLFCIFYALFGIPFTCLTLKIIGQNFLNFNVAIMAQIKKRVRERLVNPHESVPCSDMGRGPVLAVIVSLWLLTLLVLSVLAHFRRGWSLFESLYFCFITFSTIGFGDYVAFSETAVSEFLDYFIMFLGFVLGFAVTSTMLCSLCSLFEESWPSSDLDSALSVKATALRERLRRLVNIPDQKVAPNGETTRPKTDGPTPADTFGRTQPLNEGP